MTTDSAFLLLEVSLATAKRALAAARERAGRPYEYVKSGKKKALKAFQRKYARKVKGLKKAVAARSRGDGIKTHFARNETAQRIKALRNFGRSTETGRNVTASLNKKPLPGGKQAPPMSELSKALPKRAKTLPKKSGKVQARKMFPAPSTNRGRYSYLAPIALAGVIGGYASYRGRNSNDD